MITGVEETRRGRAEVLEKRRSLHLYKETMLSKRKSLNDALIIWHGMSAQNISTDVTLGLSFALRRRKIWLEILNAEVHKNSKSIVAQNFAFSTREPSMTTPSFRVGFDGGPATDDDASFVQQPPDVRVREIIEAMTARLPIQVNKYNTVIINHLASIIASEIPRNAEASKVLSFILYRDQVSSNRRPCIPTGSESHAIYADVFESCIHFREPYIYKHMLALGGYLSYRRGALMQAKTSAEFVACIEESHTKWLANNELDAFWAKCVGLHTKNFMDLYVEHTSRMRLKAVTMARQRDAHEPLLHQFQRDLFHHARYSWIGFDVDHTLVEYRMPYLLQTSFAQAAKELQRNFIGLRTIPPAVWLPTIAQRGVVIDTERGNFLHLAEDGAIQRAYHGSHEISYFSINLLYGDIISPNDDSDRTTGLLGNSSKLVYLYTAADIIYAPLYAWIVDAFDSGGLGTSLYIVPDIEDRAPENPNDPFLANRVVYISLSTHTLKAARSFYAGAFWKTINCSPELLIQPNADISSLLETLKTTLRKQLFILTNGSWTHCNAVMQFAIGRDWLRYFDLVITEAKKEIFFDELNDVPFSELVMESATNVDGAGTRASKKTVKILQRGRIYAHGNVKTLMAFFRETPSSTTSIISFSEEKVRRICYFGDHLLQDVLLPAEHTTLWDLVAIVKEIQYLNQSMEEVSCPADVLSVD
ncbi:hypothetical protein BBJ28_00000825 [Nothophytophthora sp. Chile5]|nr:hypothetical protein BBJ28_00000825 [Nothophytophthora sp. Chile5]